MSCIQLDAQICHGCGFIDYYPLDSNKSYIRFCVCERKDIDLDTHFANMEEFHFYDGNSETPDAKEIWRRLLNVRSKFNLTPTNPEDVKVLLRSDSSDSCIKIPNLPTIVEEPVLELNSELCYECGFFNYHGQRGIFRGFCVCHLDMEDSQYEYHYQMMEDFHFDDEKHHVKNANESWNYMMKFNALYTPFIDESTDDDFDDHFCGCGRCRDCVGTPEPSDDDDTDDEIDSEVDEELEEEQRVEMWRAICSGY